MTVILTYSPPLTTDNGYYRTILSDLFASDKMYRRREASACPIPLRTKQGRPGNQGVKTAKELRTVTSVSTSKVVRTATCLWTAYALKTVTAMTSTTAVRAGSWTAPVQMTVTAVSTTTAVRTGPVAIKLFSCSTQLSFKFILLINVKMLIIFGILTFVGRMNYLLL